MDEPRDLSAYGPSQSTQSGCAFILWMVILAAIVSFGFWADFQWKKYIVREAIKESKLDGK